VSNNQGQGQNQGQTRRAPVSVIAQTQQRWEYHQEDECSTARLNELGGDGWRLVGPPVIARMNLGSSGKLMYVFERPVK